MNALVIGLGLIGGSFGLSLRELDPTYQVCGADRADVITRPAAARAAQRLIDVADTTAVNQAAKAADLVFLAAPVGAIVALLPQVLEHAQLVTDAGSTKRAIARSVANSPRRGRFVAGHPMAGAPEGGIELARAGLFRDRRWLLCTERSDTDAVDRVEDLVLRLGARPIRIAIDEHDRAVALTSHATQLVASALAVSAADLGAEVAAGPGFDGATRVAGGPEAIWGDIFETNSDEVAAGLRAITSELEAVLAGLSRVPPDTAPARALLARARRLKRG
jgi:prephenate dehydrogenase